MLNLRRISILSIAAVLGLAARGWAGDPTPAYLNPPTYNYSDPDSCPACHFVDNLDHTSRAAGVLFDSTQNRFVRTGHGWFDSKHGQSDFGSTENTFCTKCHSPGQADPNTSFNNGYPVNASPVPRTSFQAVSCSTACHPSGSVAKQILAANPTAIYNGRVDIYKWGQDPTLVSSWIPILQGQEDLLCLSCHEQRHNTDNPAFAAMYSAGVKCVNCHMAAYKWIEQPGGLAENFHDWKVGQNLPYSCGAQGSGGFNSGCHSEFTADSARALIPFMKEQHIGWWNLPPFNGASSASATSSMQGMRLQTAGDYLNLWRQIQAQQQQQSKN
jgi:hypothetical protein